MSTNIKNSDGSLTKIAGKTLQYPINTNIGTSEILQDAPIGHIISYMGNTAPAHYLACDGSIYNISDYPKLADHFLANFGSKNYFGGDGTATFAVPDLRGEFLRGTGTNNHTDGGNGSNVGTHQGGTSLPRFDVETDGKLILRYNSNRTLNFKNIDFGKASASESDKYSIHNVSNMGANNWYGEVGVRPTNTSVLYCIKAEPTYFMEIKDPGYSTDEVFTGKTWIDGKPIYRKVITFQLPQVNIEGTETHLDIDASDLNIDTSISNKMVIQDNKYLFITEGYNNANRFYCYYRVSDKLFRIFNNTVSYNNMNGKLIIEYTKITD